MQARQAIGMAWLCMAACSSAPPGSAPSSSVGDVTFQIALDGGIGSADSKNDGSGKADAAKDGAHPDAATDSGADGGQPAGDAGADTAKPGPDAASAVCGDGTCDITEGNATCPNDCPPSGPACGDGACNGAESSVTCPADCPVGPPVCGDGWCQPPESPSVCPIECDAGTAAIFTCVKATCGALTDTCLGQKACSSALGDAMSCLSACGGSGQNCLQWCKTSLGNDAAATAVAQCGFAACAETLPDGYCGDGTCGTKESSATCPWDCKGAGPVCGDGVCSPPETAQQCAKDCQKSTCGNGTCGPGESTQTCPKDCPPAATAQCGDAKCDAPETATSCVFDCNPAVQPFTACGKKECPAESAACFSDPACVQAMTEALVCVGDCVAKGGTNASCQNSCAGPVVGNDKALAFAMCSQPKCAK